MSNQSNQSPNNHDVVQCLIGRGIEFKGELSFTGGLHIDGRVIGSIKNQADSTGRITLSREGIVDGNVTTCDAEINGTVNGDIHATGCVVLHPHSHVSGDVYYERIEIRRGACINGKLIATHENKPAESSSILDKLNPTRKSA